MQYKIAIIPVDSEKQEENICANKKKKNSLVKWTRKINQSFLIFFLIPFQLIALWYVCVYLFCAHVNKILENIIFFGTFD